MADDLERQRNRQINMALAMGATISELREINFVAHSDRTIVATVPERLAALRATVALCERLTRAARDKCPR